MNLDHRPDLSAVVDSIRAAAGAAPREPSPLAELAAASATFRAEFQRMDRLFDAVMTRVEDPSFTAAHVEALQAWAAVNASLFSFAGQTLDVSNAALARLA